MENSRVPFWNPTYADLSQLFARGLDLGQVQGVWEENCILYYLNYLHGALLEKGT